MAARLSARVSSVFYESAKQNLILQLFRDVAVPKSCKNRHIIELTAKCVHTSPTNLTKSAWNSYFARNTSWEAWHKLKNWKTKVAAAAGIVTAAMSADILLRTFFSGQNVRFLHVTEAAEVFQPARYQQGASAKNSKSFNFIADVVEKASPAVVYIEIQGRHPFSGQTVATSAGSGFIVDESGIILTNAHVVQNKRQVQVTLRDGRKLNGLVQYVDPVSDLATVKVDSKAKLPALSMANSSESRPGEWVVAMGNPLSLSNTITVGIVSSVGRGSHELGLHYKDMDYIQTDAAITIGNSGGPLINLDGEVIGINTMTATAGISFAIPSNHAKQFLSQVECMRKKEAKGGWLSGKTPSTPKRRYIGITMLTLAPDIVEAIRFRNPMFPDVSTGILVQRVNSGSPAQLSGLQEGDIISKIGGKAVRGSRDMYSALAADKAAGDKLELEVLRGTSTVKVTITPEDAS